MRDLWIFAVAVVVFDADGRSSARSCPSISLSLRLLGAWLLDQEAEEVVMELTAQYWKLVWGALESAVPELCQNPM
jgi:hypothetical protein